MPASSQRGFLPFPSELRAGLPLQPSPSLEPIKAVGSHRTYRALLDTHADLLEADFLLALREQLDGLRKDPRRLQQRSYEVTCTGVHTVERGRRQMEEGVELTFDASKLRDREGFLTGNLVLLFRGELEDLLVGVVHESVLAREGRVVVKLVDGVALDGHFHARDHAPFARRRDVFRLVESEHFYFPCLHVTNALRRDARDPERTFDFKSEIVGGVLPSDKPPRYAAELDAIGGLQTTTTPTRRHRGVVREQRRSPDDGGAAAYRLLDEFQRQLNPSQMAALEGALARRVALVQGPPGTGKTFLGCKLVQYFVALRHSRAARKLLPGPVLVITTTNHAVHDFLSRCMAFTDKIIHGYSERHEQARFGALQEQYDASHKSGQRRELMRSADILAMTTTRAAFMRPTLDKLGIKIVLVEEAAEAPEGYVLAAIPQDAENIIQIGDHKQLRPSTAFAPLAASHGLEVSLFERLVRNGAHCPMLNEQRRMRPAIAHLVRGIYPALRDHDTTEDRPGLLGVDLDEPVFLLSHCKAETPDGNGYSNSFEAEMAAELTAYLLWSGLAPENVTVLTTYRRQHSLISSMLRAMGADAARVRVTTVDNFQGEENRVIVLSLVRSNSSGNVGFLKLENRACVALSRARDAFFMLGDLDCLAASGSAVWQRVRDVLGEAGHVGRALPLVCPHGALRTKAATPADVRAARRGCVACRASNVLRDAEEALARAEVGLRKERRRVEDIEDELEEDALLMTARYAAELRDERAYALQTARRLEKDVAAARRACDAASRECERAEAELGWELQQHRQRKQQQLQQHRQREQQQHRQREQQQHRQREDDYAQRAGGGAAANSGDFRGSSRDCRDSREDFEDWNSRGDSAGDFADVGGDYKDSRRDSRGSRDSSCSTGDSEDYRGDSRDSRRDSRGDSEEYRGNSRDSREDSRGSRDSSYSRADSSRDFGHSGPRSNNGICKAYRPTLAGAAASSLESNVLDTPALRANAAVTPAVSKTTPTMSFTDVQKSVAAVSLGSRRGVAPVDGKTTTGTGRGRGDFRRMLQQIKKEGSEREGEARPARGRGVIALPLAGWTTAARRTFRSFTCPGSE